MTATLEHSPPRPRALVAAAVVPLVALGLVVTAVLVLLLGLWGLLVGLVLTAAAVLVRAWMLTHGVRDRVLASLGARPVDAGTEAGLVNLAEGISATCGVPVPDLFVLDDPGANVLLVGESADAPAMVVTTGLLDALDRIQLEAVVARGFAELRLGGLPASSIAVEAVAKPRQALARGGVGAVTVRPLAGLVAAGYDAVAGPDRDLELDRAGAALTRYPPGLVSALEQLERVGTAVARAEPTSAHLWIADPGAAIDGTPPRPPLELRVEALRLL